MEAVHLLPWKLLRQLQRLPDQALLRDLQVHVLDTRPISAAISVATSSPCFYSIKYMPLPKALPLFRSVDRCLCLQLLLLPDGQFPLQMHTVPGTHNFHSHTALSHGNSHTYVRSLHRLRSCPTTIFPPMITPPPTPVPSVTMTRFLHPAPPPFHISPSAATFASFPNVRFQSGQLFQFFFCFFIFPSKIGTSVYNHLLRSPVPELRLRFPMISSFDSMMLFHLPF